MQLERCLNSLLKNAINVPNEIIIVNNSSNTNINLYRRNHHQTKITYINTSNNNVPFARNFAISKASNNFCAFIDDDCRAQKGWLQVAYFTLLSDEYMFISGSCRSTPHLSWWQYIEHKITSLFFLRYRKRWKNNTYLYFLDTKNCAFDRRILKKKNVLFDVNIKRLEDVDFSYNLAAHHIKIRFVKEMKVFHDNQKGFFHTMKNYYLRGYYQAAIEEKWKPYSCYFQKKETRFCVGGVGLYISFTKIISYLGSYTYALRRWLKS